MAASIEQLLQAMHKLSGELNITFKKEQEDAIKNLFLRRDLLAVFPTGFAKSIVQMLIKASCEVRKKHKE